jgi:hypothetical protein
MQTAWQDIRYGLRGFIRERGFTALAVITLALGIGAATTIFSVIQNVLINPFPYKDADRVSASTGYVLSARRAGISTRKRDDREAHDDGGVRDKIGRLIPKRASAA